VELDVLKRVRERHSNLHLMIPFVRTLTEFRACKRLVDASGLTDQRDFELWIMGEVPSVVHWLPEYAALGIAGVSIGSNDLTQLVLGIDRDSQVLAPLFDERDHAVIATIEAIVMGCRRLGIKSSICGQAPSVYPDYAELLVNLGIDSISVNPDAIDTTRYNVAAAEQRLLLYGLRNRPAS
jgi:pyruvate,water dikinase